MQTKYLAEIIMIIITIVCSFMRRGFPAIIRCAQHVQPQMDSIIGYDRRMRIIRHTTGRRRNPRVQSTKPHSSIYLPPK